MARLTRSRAHPLRLLLRPFLLRRSASSSKSPTELLRLIGRGSYGEVWLARNMIGTLHAVKVVHRKTFDRDRPYDREFEGIRNFEPISSSRGLCAYPPGRPE